MPADKKSLLETLMETVFGKSSKEKPHTRKRTLGLEQLENRELLSVTVGFHSTQDAWENGQSGWFRLERDDTASALTVNYELDWRNADSSGCGGGPGWATAGSDFHWLPGTSYWSSVGSVTFAAGEQYVDINVTPINDNIVEGDEQVRLTLLNDSSSSSSSSVYIVDPQKTTASLLIHDDDVAPTVWVQEVQNATESSFNGYIRIQRDNTANALTVRCQLHSNNGNNYGCGPAGWASNGIDFNWLPGTDDYNNVGYVTFQAGQSYVDIQINPINDNIVEGTEKLEITLLPDDPYYSGNSTAAYNLDNARKTATLLIYDDDVAPTVWVEQVQNATEGSSNGYIRIQRDNTANALTVRCQLHSNNGNNYGCGPAGWASNGIDFNWLPGTDDYNNVGYITFAAGQAYADIAINPINDTQTEGTEKLEITLLPDDPYYSGNSTAAYNLDNARKTATLLIYDDDDPSNPPPGVAPQVWIEKVRDTTEGGDIGLIRIYRSHSNGNLTVRYQLDAANMSGANTVGKATAGVDFDWLPGMDGDSIYGTITFQSGQSHVTLSINALSDTLVEGPETLQITLVGDDDETYQLDGTRASATLTILDANRWTVEVESSDPVGQKGGGEAEVDPLVPTGLAAELFPGSETSIRVRWNAVDGAASYRVQRSMDGVHWESLTATTSTELRDWNREPGVEYYYRVASLDAANQASSYSDPVSGRCLARLDAPVLTSPSQTDRSITLSWTAIDNALSYECYYSRNGGQTWTWGFNVAATTHVFAPSHYSFDAEYLFEIKALAKTGGGYMSSHASNRLSNFDATGTTSRSPQRPSGLAATPAGTSSIELSWNAVKLAENYRVEYKDSPNGTWATAYLGSATSFTATGLDAGNFCYYRVIAINSAGESQASYIVSACTEMATIDPNAPAGLHVYADRFGIVNVTWNAAPDASSCQLQRSENGGATWTTVMTKNALSYQHTNPGVGVEYAYRVAAIDAEGDVSGYSNIATGRKFTPVDAPAATIISRTENMIVVAWETVDNAINHNVQVSTDGGATWSVVHRDTPANAYVYMYDISSNPDGEYRFRVQVVSVEAGYAQSPVGDAAISLPVTQMPVAPPRPDNLAVIAVEASKITLSWNAAIAATGYLVEMAASSDGPWTTVYEGAENTFTHTGLAPEVFYYYRVRSIGEAGLSDPTYAVSARTLIQISDPITFTVTRSGSDDASLPLTIYYRLSGSARPGVDYIVGSGIYDTENNYGTITIPAGAYSAEIRLDIPEDAPWGPSKTVFLTLLDRQPGSSEADAWYVPGESSSADATIIGDYELPRIGIDSVTNAVEGGASGIIRLYRTNTTGAVTVRYQLGGTTTSGVDYEPLSGSVTFQGGMEYAEIIVATIDNNLLEGDKTVTLTLLESENEEYLLGGNVHTILVIADDENVMLVSAGRDYSCEPGGSVRLEASIVNDPTGVGGWTYAWDLDGDGVFETAGGSPLFDAAGIDAEGVRTVTVRATDTFGNTATATAVVTLAFARPVLEVTIPSRDNAIVANGDTVTFGPREPGNAVQLTFEFTNTGNRPLELDAGSLVLPEGVTLVGHLQFMVQPGASCLITLRWNADSDLDGTVTLATNAPGSPLLTIHLTGTLIAFSDPPQIVEFGLVHDSGSDATDRVTANPMLTGRVAGNLGGGRATVEFDINGDGIADGRAAVDPDTLSFVFDPRDLNDFPDIGAVAVSYRLVHADAYGEILTTGDWTSFSYTLTAAPSINGTIQNLRAHEGLGESGYDYSGLQVSGYGQYLSNVEIVVPSTGEVRRITVENGWFAVPLLEEIPYGETATIRVRAFRYDESLQMNLYGDWQEVTYTPRLQEISELTLKNDTGTSNTDGITSDLTLVGRINSVRSDGTGQRNAYVEIELRIGGEIIGRTWTDKDGKFTYIVPRLPESNGVYEGVVVACVVGRNAEGEKIDGTSVEKYLRYEIAPAYGISSISLVNPQEGNKTHDAKVKANIYVPIGGDVRYEYVYDIDGVRSGPFYTTPYGSGNLPENATHETRSAEFVLYDLLGLDSAAQVVLYVRSLVYDSVIDGDRAGVWSALTFTYAPETDLPANVESAWIKQWTGQYGVSTGNPTIVGRVTNDGSVENLLVEAWRNGNYVGSALTDKEGNFTLTPGGLEYGVNTLEIKVRELNRVTGQYQYGNAVEVTFTLLAPTITAPVVELSLADDPLGSKSVSHPLLHGKLQDDGQSPGRVLIEIDIDGDFTPDAQVFTASNGTFKYLPNLDVGTHTVLARACRFDNNTQQWVVGDWTSLTFTVVEPETNWRPQVTEIGPARQDADNPGTSHDPTIAGRVTSQGGYDHVIVQVETALQGTREMKVESDGSFRWTPVIDRMRETPIAGRSRAGYRDPETGIISWGDWTAFSYVYKPVVPETPADPGPTTPVVVKTALELVYTKSEDGDVTASGVRVTGTNYYGNINVEFDIDGDGKVDCTVTPDSQGFVSFDALRRAMVDLHYGEKTFESLFAEGLLVGKASITVQEESGEYISSISIAIVNVRDESRRSELEQRRNEFYQSYVALLEAQAELDELLNSRPPGTSTGGEVGETMTDEQRAQARKDALEALGLSEQDIAPIEGPTAPVLQPPSLEQETDIAKDVEYQQELARIEAEYQAAIAQINRQAALAQQQQDTGYNDTLDAAWGDHYQATAPNERWLATVGATAGADEQAERARQTAESQSAYESTALAAMLGYASNAAAQQAQQQQQLLAAWQAAATKQAQAANAAAMRAGGYSSQFLANALAEMQAAIAAQVAYANAMMSAQQAATNACLQAWHSAAESSMKTASEAQRRSIEAWKTVKTGAEKAKATYDKAMAKADQDYAKAVEGKAEALYEANRQAAIEFNEEAASSYYYYCYQEEILTRKYYNGEITEEERIAAMLAISEEIGAKDIALFKAADSAFVDREAAHQKAMNDAAAKLAIAKAKAGAAYEKACIGLLSGYWNETHEIGVMQQKSSIGVSSAYAGALNGAESGLASASLAASTALESALLGAAEARANADIGTENAMLAAEGAHYAAQGHDMELYNTSLAAATALVNSLVSKSFGAANASLAISSGLSETINGAIDGFASAMLGISTGYAMSNISSSASLESARISAQIAYMKAATSAQENYQTSLAAHKQEAANSKLSFLADAVKGNIQATERYVAVGLIPYYEGWYSQGKENWGHSGPGYHFGKILVCAPDDPNVLALDQAASAKAAAIGQTYSGAMKSAENAYVNTMTNAAKNAAEQQYQAAKSAMQGEQAAVEGFCNSVEQAYLAANRAMADIARNFDATGDIMSYLKTMLAAESAANARQVAKFGASQIAQKQAVLDGLSPDDPRYAAALADLEAAVAANESRNDYYNRQAEIDAEYYDAYFGAMAVYQRTQLDNQLNAAQQALESRFTYDQNVRKSENAYQNAMLESSRSHGQSLIDQIFEQWESETPDTSAIDAAAEAARAGHYADYAQSLLDAETALTLENVAGTTGAVAADAAAYDAWLAAIAAIEAKYAAACAELESQLKQSIDTGQNWFDDDGCDWDHALETSERFFDGDTWVLMADGSMKKISELHVGDKVMAIPHDNPDGEAVPCEVTAVESGESQNAWQLIFDNENGETLELTACEGHPFYVDGKGWVDVQDLETGDVVVTADGAAFTLQEKLQVEEEIRTWSLTVDGNHTFFVGDGDGDWVLVHNADSKKGGGWRLPTADDIGANWLADQTFGRIGRWMSRKAWEGAKPIDEAFPNGINTKPQPAPDWVHTSLDGAGLAEGVGIVPDLINAGLYAVEGKPHEACVSCISALPFAGTVVTSTKWGKKLLGHVTGSFGTRFYAKLPGVAEPVLKNAEGLVVPLGRGSTGRTAAETLKEQIAMKQVLSNPGKGATLPDLKMNDARWPASEGWEKWRYNVDGVEIHYVHNPKTGDFDDFKYK